MPRWMLDKRIPITLLVTLLLQAGATIWWAAGQDRADTFHDTRLSALEYQQSRFLDTQSLIADRLARIEERLIAEGESLRRIEKQITSFRP
jgi:hypothetical protein